MDRNYIPQVVGYARVSTGGQDLKLQLDALKAAGVAKIETARPGLGRCLAALQPGDTLFVCRLDRLGRSLRHLVDLIENLHQRGVGFRSACESIDTTTANGRSWRGR